MSSQRERGNGGPARIFLCGDVMTGRGIDQILPRPCAPQIFESYAHLALDYVQLAEQANGPIPKPVEPSYPWGVALDKLDRRRPDLRIVNLETSITRSEEAEPKGINYRMSPENAECLASARIDCCTLANNHVLDWGRAGFIDTLETLERLRIKTAGAGRNLAEACAPAVLQLGSGSRVLVFAYAAASSGVPREWAATPTVAGVNLLPDLSDGTVQQVSTAIDRVRRPGDLMVVSIHWGSNWGYAISRQQRRFAHALVDQANVSIVHGHSSHHPRPIEVYRGRLILYGCGDFLNDYEGIQGYERFRGDLAVMYFADVERTTGALTGLTMVPLQLQRFRLHHASGTDARWLAETLNRESAAFRTCISLDQGGSLYLGLPQQPLNEPEPT